MTSARRPAGAPEDWAGRRAAGEPPAETGDEQVEEAAGTGTAPANDANLPHSGNKASEDAEDAAAEGVAADLDALLADVRRERDEYLELAQRAKADFENYRKRAARDVADAERRSKAALARELVPAIDNLERALESGGGDAEGLAKGVALVLGELRATLERAGVESYDPAGERFDPAWHEALQTRATPDTEAGVIVETLERGYRLDGQVLRPARVVVSE